MQAMTEVAAAVATPAFLHRATLASKSRRTEKGTVEALIVLRAYEVFVAFVVTITSLFFALVPPAGAAVSQLMFALSSHLGDGGGTSTTGGDEVEVLVVRVEGLKGDRRVAKKRFRV